MGQRKTRGYDVMTAKERDYFRKRVWSTLRSVIESSGSLRTANGFLGEEVIDDLHQEQL